MIKHVMGGIVLAGLICQSHGAPLPLSDVLQRVKNESKPLQQSQASLDAAKQTKSQAFTKWFPQVALHATVMKSSEGLVQMDNSGGNLPVYNGDPATIPLATQYAYMPASSVSMLEQGGAAALSVIQPIYMGGRIVNGNQLATLGVDVAQLQMKLTEKKELYAVQAKYWDLAALQAQRKTLVAQSMLMDTLMFDVRIAFQQGFATSRDTLDLSIRCLQVLNQIQDIDAGIALSEQDLCRTMGGNCPTGPWELDSLGPLHSPEHWIVDHSAYLNKRPESQLLDLSVKAERLKGELGQGEFRPQAAVGAALVEMGDFESKPMSRAIVFANVSVPLSGLWEGSHKAQESQRNERRTSLVAEEQKELLRLEMDKARMDLESRWRALQISQLRLGKEKIAMTDSRLGLSQGMSKASDVVDTQLHLQIAENDDIAARKDYLKACAYYKKAIGVE